ncbi:hypothetical protein DFAR_2010004 [Desulfarculales bacterium]
MAGRRGAGVGVWGHGFFALGVTAPAHGLFALDGTRPALTVLRASPGYAPVLPGESPPGRAVGQKHQRPAQHPHGHRHRGLMAAMDDLVLGTAAVEFHALHQPVLDPLGGAAHAPDRDADPDAVRAFAPARPGGAKGLRADHQSGTRGFQRSGADQGLRPDGGRGGAPDPSRARLPGTKYGASPAPSPVLPPNDLLHQPETGHSAGGWRLAGDGRLHHYRRLRGFYRLFEPPDLAHDGARLCGEPDAAGQGLAPQGGRGASRPTPDAEPAPTPPAAPRRAFGPGGARTFLQLSRPDFAGVKPGGFLGPRWPDQGPGRADGLGQIHPTETLFSRHYDQPSRGVWLAEVNVLELAPATRRALMVQAPQEAFLFSATVRALTYS